MAFILLFTYVFSINNLVKVKTQLVIYLILKDEIDFDETLNKIDNYILLYLN